MRWSHRGRIVVVVVAMVALGLAAAVAAVNGSHAPVRPAAPSAAPPRPKVIVVGNSITNFARARIATALAGAYDAQIHAVNGNTAGDLEPALAALVGTRPDAAIIEAGAADAARHVVQWRTELDAMVATVRDVPCVELVTVPLAEDTLGQFLDPQRHPYRIAASWNAALRAIAAGNPHIHLIDWQAEIATHPAVSLDGIHPADPAGTQWIAMQYRAALDRDCG